MAAAKEQISADLGPRRKLKAGAALNAVVQDLGEVLSLTERPALDPDDEQLFNRDRVQGDLT